MWVFQLRIFFFNQTDKTKSSLKKSIYEKVAFLMYFSINYYFWQLEQ